MQAESQGLGHFTWREHENGLRRGVDWERVRALHRATALAGHAVAASRVGKP